MKFLFAVTDFDMGGITESLKNLTNELLKNGDEVSIINLPNEETTQFDGRIKIVELKGLSKYWNVNISDFNNARGIKKTFLLFFGIVKKILSKFGMWEKVIFVNQPKIRCDVAIAYRQSPECYYICRKKTTAKRTIAFIHNEFDGDCSSWAPHLAKIDKIACVSDDWRDNFKKTFPYYRDKVFTVYNLFNIDELKYKADKFYPREFDSTRFNIVTTARIDLSTKRLNIIPTICNRLLEKGIDNFSWFIVGDGQDRTLLENAIDDAKMNNRIFILGRKTNPYPFVKNADLFVLTSCRESYGMVLKESVILGTPVVTTKYPASYEVIRENEQGLITDFDAESIANGIERLYKDKELYNMLKENCVNYKYRASVVYNQLMKLCK